MKIKKIIPYIICIMLISTLKTFANENILFNKTQKGTYIIKIKKNQLNLNLYPYFSDSLEELSNIAKKENAKIAINTGFFDPNNKKTISYVIKNQILIGDPTKNENLTKNKSLKEFLPKIFNRSEFRVLEDNQGLLFDITNHKTPIKEGQKLVHAIGGGPQLYPKLRLEEEAFIVKKDNKIVKQSAGALIKHARTAIGFDNKFLYIIIFDNENKVTLCELAQYIKSLNLTKAMAFDGGSSTSLYVNLPEKKLTITSGKDNQSRKIKSALIIR